MEERGLEADRGLGIKGLAKRCYIVYMDVEPKIGGFYPPNGWFISWKTVLKWMIWGYHYCWKHPYLPGTGVCVCPFFWGDTTLQKNQNRGHLGSRYKMVNIYTVYIYISSTYCKLKPIVYICVKLSCNINLESTDYWRCYVYKHTSYMSGYLANLSRY